MSGNTTLQEIVDKGNYNDIERLLDKTYTLIPSSKHLSLDVKLVFNSSNNFIGYEYESTSDYKYSPKSIRLNKPIEPLGVFDKSVGWIAIPSSFENITFQNKIPIHSSLLPAFGCPAALMYLDNVPFGKETCIPGEACPLQYREAVIDSNGYLESQQYYTLVKSEIDNNRVYRQGLSVIKQRVSYDITKGDLITIIKYNMGLPLEAIVHHQFYSRSTNRIEFIKHFDIKYDSYGYPTKISLRGNLVATGPIEEYSFQGPQFHGKMIQKRSDGSITSYYTVNHGVLEGPYLYQGYESTMRNTGVEFINFYSLNRELDDLRRNYRSVANILQDRSTKAFYYTQSPHNRDSDWFNRYLDENSDYDGMSVEVSPTIIKRQNRNDEEVRTLSVTVGYHIHKARVTAQEYLTYYQSQYNIDILGDIFGDIKVDNIKQLIIGYIKDQEYLDYLRYTIAKLNNAYQNNTSQNIGLIIPGEVDKFINIANIILMSRM